MAKVKEKLPYATGWLMITDADRDKIKPLENPLRWREYVKDIVAITKESTLQEFSRALEAGRAYLIIVSESPPKPGQMEPGRVVVGTLASCPVNELRWRSGAIWMGKP